MIGSAQFTLSVLGFFLVGGGNSLRRVTPETPIQGKASLYKFSNANCKDESYEIMNQKKCARMFYAFDLDDPDISECYEPYLDKEISSSAQKEVDLVERANMGPLFVAKYMQYHPCVTRNLKEADAFLLPPALPSWKKQKGSENTCKAKLHEWIRKSQAFDAMAMHNEGANAVVLGGSRDDARWPELKNAIPIVRDCGDSACNPEEVLAWPTYDVEPKVEGLSFQREYNHSKFLAAGAWKSKHAGKTFARIKSSSLENALKSRDDTRFSEVGSDLPAAIYENFIQSKFCLIPKGESLSSESLTPCVLSGSIPVILHDELSLPHQQVLDYKKFTVRLSSDLSGEQVLDHLQAIPESDVDAMRQNLACVRNAFLYDQKHAASRGGPIDMILKGVVELIRAQKPVKSPYAWAK